MTMPPRHHRTYKPLLDTQGAKVRAAIDDGLQPYADAQEWFLKNKAATALKAAPLGVYKRVKWEYPNANADAHNARTNAVAFLTTGKPEYAIAAIRDLVMLASVCVPEPFSDFGSLAYQGGYHQSYFAFSAALAYDLVRSECSAGQRVFIEAWLHKLSDVLKGYQDHFAAKYIPLSGTIDYGWTAPNGKVLKESAKDYGMGRDTAICPEIAWLACALASRYAQHIDLLFNPSYLLSVPAVLHAACAPDNEGDGRGTVPAPQVQVNAGPKSGSGAGGLAYMTYNARCATILYDMTRQLGRVTPRMTAELKAMWHWLAEFYSPLLMLPLWPGDKKTWTDLLPRMWLALHCFPDDPVIQAAVNGKQAPLAQLYDGQYLGPVVLLLP
jgi:hypothetical protein